MKVCGAPVKNRSPTVHDEEVPPMNDLLQSAQDTLTRQFEATPGWGKIAYAIDGREQFTPHPLASDRMYRVTIAGTYTYRDQKGNRRRADAAFVADDHDNLAIRY